MSLLYGASLATGRFLQPQVLYVGKSEIAISSSICHRIGIPPKPAFYSKLHGRALRIALKLASKESGRLHIT